METYLKFGDSETRGLLIGNEGGVNQFSDVVPISHPLYKLRSWWSIANEIMRENDAPVRFAWCDSFIGTNFEVVADMAQQSWVAGMIFQDAGDVQSPSTYEQAWTNGLGAAFGKPLYAMTTYNGPNAPSNAKFNVVVHDGKTLNQMIATAADEQATLIDNATKIASFQTYLNGQTQSQVIDTDHIHTGVWGGCCVVGQTLKATGAIKYARSIKVLKKVVEDNWQHPRLQAGAPSNFWLNSSHALNFLQHAIYESWPT